MTLVYGETAIAKVLIASQVVLGLQLPFAIVPLIRATSSRAAMRPHANGRFVTVVAVAVATIIVSLNGAHSAEMLELPLRASGVPEHVLLPPVAAAFPVLGLGMARARLLQTT